MTELEREDIVCIAAVKEDDKAKLVIRTQYPYFEAKILLCGSIYLADSNIIEPFDRTTHVFIVRSEEIDKAKFVRFICKEDDEDEELYFDFEMPEYSDTARLAEDCNNGVCLIEAESAEIADGAVYIRYDCTDKTGAPVKAFALFINLQKLTLAVGTPDDGFQSVNCRQTVEKEALAAIANGKKVIAATNADFFDMFGDDSPSGLCVKDGRVIANADSEREFFAILKSGKVVITSLKESPQILGEIRQAVGGLGVILKHGKIADFIPLEPFGFLRHPRTAVGIDKNGNVILLVVDGRIPEYSNGASLIDLAEMLKALGAENAINLDGGGSSILLLKSGTTFKTVNNPADLFKPTERLIREGFNSLLVVEQ